MRIVSLVVVGLHLALSGCGKSAEEKKKEELEEQDKAAQEGDPTDPGTPPPPPTPSGPGEFVFANATEKEWTGTGNKVVDGIVLKKGGAVFRFKHEGESNFIVQLLEPTGADAGPSQQNEIGKVDGAEDFVEVEADGDYKFEVQADGAWTIAMRGVEKGDFPSALEGTGMKVTHAFTLEKDKPYKLSATHDGDSNFSVILFNAGTGKYGDLLVNEIGAYNGESAISVKETGYYLLEIDADGKWTANVE